MIVAMVALYLIAASLEVVGLGMAYAGFAQTWGEFGRGGKFHHMLAREFSSHAGKAGRRAKHLWYRLIRKSVDQTIHVGSAQASVSVGGVAVGHASEPLPSFGDDPEAFARAVGARLSKLEGDAALGKSALDREREQRKQQDVQITREFDNRVGQLEHLSKKVAVDGLFLQFSGWVCILLGVILGLVADLLSLGR